jgi:predicted metal-dependent HD superfamily phosphohydrolase
MDDLRARWPLPGADELRERLLAAYDAPRRGYHDLTHLAEVLGHVDLLAAEADQPDVVRLAAWFHDAVYDPTATDNEERSAALAITTLRRLGLDEPLLADVARLVHLTVTHEVADDDHDGAVLCDADLAVLASDDLRYSSYTEGVRREYAHVDDAAFATGRARVLSTLLARPTLFRTVHGRSAWEQRARANVTAELARLRAP